MNDIKIMEIKAELVKSDVASLMNMLDDAFFKGEDIETSGILAEMLLNKVREYETIEKSLNDYFKDSKRKWGEDYDVQ